MTFLSCNYYDMFILHLPSCFLFPADASLSAKTVTLSYICHLLFFVRLFFKVWLDANVKNLVFQDTEYYALRYCK